MKSCRNEKDPDSGPNTWVNKRVAGKTDTKEKERKRTQMVQLNYTFSLQIYFCGFKYIYIYMKSFQPNGLLLN